MGPVSGVQHQEFLLIKINQRGKKQERVFGIDGYNIYNFRSKKSNKKPTFIGSLAKKILNIRKKIRPISNLEEIKKLDDKKFELVFKSNSGAKKSLTYLCYTPDNCSEILAKLNFIKVIF